MCGIFLAHKVKKSIKELEKLFNKLQHRGPDNSGSIQLDNTFYGFHRLAIINPETGCNQPFYDGKNEVYVLCNGEIYNWHLLCEEYDLPKKESSDCEVILHLYNKFGFEKMVKLLEGEFAIILHDKKQNKIFACRDICGIRPLFYSFQNGELYLASELKAIPSNNVHHIYPRIIYTFHSDRYDTEPYWNFPVMNNISIKPTKALYNKIADDLYEILYGSVKLRLESSREKGFFLSGGIDSSLICALAQKIEPGIKCYTIGMLDSPDVKAAKKVAKFIGADLTIIPFNIEKAINDLPELIWYLETYDITTIRASALQFQLCKWISKNTDIKILYSGEVADELCSSYIYSKMAPNLKALHNDAIRLLSEIHYYDALRLDRTCASQGLECRVPYMNVKYIEYMLNLSPELRRCDNKIEKYLIRHMIDKYNLLPKEITFRQKEAFSDGVSGKVNWITALATYAEKIFDMNIENKIIENETMRYNHLKPETAEQLLYRQLFDSMMTDREHILEHYWMPKWTNVNDPSATKLAIY